MRGFLRVLAGFIPAFVLVGIAVVLSFNHVFVLSMAFSVASATYSTTRGLMLRSRRLKAQAEQAAWLPPSPQAVPRDRQPFEPFATCPGCNMATYHLFGPDRTHVEIVTTYEESGDDEEVTRLSVWNRTGMYKVHGGRKVETPQSIRVVDRECLQCGKTWEETPTPPPSPEREEKETQ